MDEVYSAHFSYVNKAEFLKTWADLAMAVGVPIEKLGIDDRIIDFVKGRHLPEMYMEKIEAHFQSHGIELSKTDVRLTIGEVMTKLLPRPESSGTDSPS